MAEYDVGALMVMSGSKLLGILSERDYARKGILLGHHSRDTKVSEIMTSPVVSVTPPHGGRLHEFDDRGPLPSSSRS